MRQQDERCDLFLISHLCLLQVLVSHFKESVGRPLREPVNSRTVHQCRVLTHAIPTPPINHNAFYPDSKTTRLHAYRQRMKEILVFVKTDTYKLSHTTEQDEIAASSRVCVRTVCQCELSVTKSKDYAIVLYLSVRLFVHHRIIHKLWISSHRTTLCKVHLNGSPTGLIPSTMCRLARTRSMRNANISAGVSSTPAFLAASARPLRTYRQTIPHLQHTDFKPI